jgi:hypothetical protein
MSVLGALLVKHLIKKGLKSATVWATGAGAATVIPFLDNIPEQYRGYVLLGWAGVILVSRLRGEISEAIAEAKAQK